MQLYNFVMFGDNLANYQKICPEYVVSKYLSTRNSRYCRAVLK